MAVAPEPEGEQDGIIRAAADFPGALVDRGIGFQAAGFAVVLLASTTVLKLFQGSSFWLYQWFDIAATGTYWSSIVPLAALFDWMRKMFERGKAIREAKKAEIRAEERRRGRAEGRTAENERLRALLEASGLALPPEIAEAMFGDDAQNGS